MLSFTGKILLQVHSESNSPLCEAMNTGNSRWLKGAAVFLSSGEKVTVQSPVFADLGFERAQHGLH